MKKKRILILILAVLLIIVLTAIKFINKMEADLRQTGKPVAETKDPKEDGELNLSGFGVIFENYKGFLKTSEIGYFLEDITTIQIPELAKDIKGLDDNGLKKYYSEYPTEIANYFGKENETDFISFAKKIQKISTDLTTWYRLDLITDSFENVSNKPGYAHVDYKVLFLNDDEVTFSLYLARKSNVSVKYIVDVK